MNRKPRRPAQLSAEQIEAIEGNKDVAYNSELAHTSAQALLPMGRHYIEYDPQVRARILDLVHKEGVDVIAETWIDSPSDSLPGILWRIYLLHEWIVQYEPTVTSRFTAATHTLNERGEQEKIEKTPTPQTLAQRLNNVLNGHYDGHVDDVLRDCARFTDVLAEISTVWIDSDNHELATHVTRRDKAMALTSREFRTAAHLSFTGGLE